MNEYSKVEFSSKDVFWMNTFDSQFNSLEIIAEDKNGNPKTSIWFSGVFYLNIPNFFNGISIEAGDEKERNNFERKSGIKIYFPKRELFEIFSEGHKFFLCAASIEIVSHKK